MSSWKQLLILTLFALSSNIAIFLGKKKGKGPGLYTDIGKKARGDSSLASFLAFVF